MKQKPPSNVVWLTLILVLSLGAKIFFSACEVEDLVFLLNPISKIVGVFTDQRYEFVSNQGYRFEELHILIGKSCAGMNFYIICFCALTVIGLRIYTHNITRIALILGNITLGYLVTVVTNASRILGALKLKQLKDLLPLVNASWFHETQGSLFYLVSLIFTTWLFIHLHHKLLRRYVSLS